MPDGSSLIAARECDICGSTDDLRVVPIMTGDKFGEAPKHPICGQCVRAWYESGETTAHGILRFRLREASRA